jgi:Cu2+-exporting ATPase
MNLGWAMIYNIIAIPVAAGLLLPIWKIVLTPGQAGILMAVSSITVVGNSTFALLGEIVEIRFSAV